MSRAERAKSLAPQFRLIGMLLAESTHTWYSEARPQLAIRRWALLARSLAYVRTWAELRALLEARGLIDRRDYPGQLGPQRLVVCHVAPRPGHAITGDTGRTAVPRSGP